MCPGPDTILLVRSVLRTRKETSGYWCAAGISTGLLFHSALSAAVIFGLGTLIPRGTMIIQATSAIVLGGLGFWLLCGASQTSQYVSHESSHSNRDFYLQGLITNL